MTSPHPDFPTFMSSIEGGHDSTVNMLLNDEKIGLIRALNAVDPYGKSPFLLAASCGRITIMKALVAAGADVHAVDNYKTNAVTLAAENNHAEAVRLLVEMGVDCRKPDVFGQQAIHRACKKGHAAAVRALIQAGGVDPDEHDSRGQTPKQIADDGKFFDLQQLIKSALHQKKKAAKALKKQQQEAAAAAAAANGEQQSAAAAAAAGAAPAALSSSPIVGPVEQQQPSSPAGGPATTASPGFANNKSGSQASELSALGRAPSEPEIRVGSAKPDPDLPDSKSTTATSGTAQRVSADREQLPEKEAGNAPTPSNSVGSSNVTTAGNSRNNNFNNSFSSSSSMGGPSASNAMIFHPDVQSMVGALLDRVRQVFPPYLIIDFTDIQLLQKLGGGGGGTVFKALIKSTDRMCAAKLFRDADAALEQAVGECQTAMILHHGNVINMLGVSVVGTMWPMPSAEIMMLMDLGKTTLQTLLGDYTDDTGADIERFAGYFSWERVIRCLWQICSGLNYLHSHRPHQIIHRDLKPANVIGVDESPLDGLSGLKICDFGLTKQNLQSETTKHIEVTNAGLGTTRWAPPEQLFSSRIGCEADVYSLGAICFWLCSGRCPWREQEQQGIDIKESQLRERLFLRDTFKPRRDCPKFLAELTLVCLSPDPTKRPPNGAALLDLLRKGSAEMVEASKAAAAGGVGVGTNMQHQVTGLDMTYMSGGASSTAAAAGLSAEEAAAQASGDATEQIVGVEPSDCFA